MKPDNNTAAICGLFCAICPSYPVDCGGCLSPRVAPSCQTCGNGFRKCAAEHNVTRCFECHEFPCARLESFSKEHVVDGIGHHANVIIDLEKMKAQGIDSWVAEQTQEHTCPSCEGLIPWNKHECPSCSGTCNSN